MKMREKAELEKTRRELTQALHEIDNIERLSLVTEDKAGLQEQVATLTLANNQLTIRNNELTTKSKRDKEEREDIQRDLETLRAFSSKLQGDIEKVTEEKILLSKIVKNTQGENEVLGKVMERISTDYEELKKAFESQKCPKDDKILALRKTARALETENELLQDEVKRLAMEAGRCSQDQLAARDQQSQLARLTEENQQLQASLQASDQERLRLARQLAAVEKQLETSRTQINKRRKK